MRILLSADPMIAVPPLGYGGIERIIDALARKFRERGHQVGLVAHRDSRCPVDAFFPWPGADPASTRDTMLNTWTLLRATARFRPHLVHSFSRLVYLAGILPLPVPKIMSYQRHTGPRSNRHARRLAHGTLGFTGCSEFICNQGRPAGGVWRAVPNFVDATAYAFRPTVAADAPLVFLSRLDPEKGPDLAIAIARAAGRKLIIAGNAPTQGSARKYYETAVAPHFGRDGVEYVGEVDDRQKNLLLGSAAAMLVPIQWDEPFGIVFAESLATGTPVITCRRGALPEIIEPGRTGWFISDAAEGVEAVRKIPELSRAACRAAVDERFNLDFCATQYLEFYEQVIARRDPPGR